MSLYDVAIIGGGPAGLSAALLLGRSRRRVIVIDHGHPRNYAAKAVHGYLGLDGIAPLELRQRGRDQCAEYGVDFLDSEVLKARRCNSGTSSYFELRVRDRGSVHAKKLLLATGMKDELPAVRNIEAFYGTSVHHCPYCDAWEHRGEHLVAFGRKESVVALGLELLNWSRKVTVCSDGFALSQNSAARLSREGIDYRAEAVQELMGANGILVGLSFACGETLSCDAIFFGTSQQQRSSLPCELGCECDEDGLIKAQGKQSTGMPGLFIAGDADGDVQFAIVAAAEGVIAATAINRELQQESLKDCE
jgi:thioredoxin reductase